VKCGRCQNDVPVLTPSPEGDQDLCEDCYATAYRELMGKRKGPTGAIIGVVVLVLAVAVGAYFAFSGSNGDSPPAPEDDNPRASLNGPKKNVAKSVKPRTRKKPRPKPDTTPEKPPAPKKEPPPEEEPPPDEEPPPEEEPFPEEEQPPEEVDPEEEPVPGEGPETEPTPAPQGLDTPLFSLMPGSFGPAGSAAVTLLNAEEGEASTLAIEPRDGTLCELSLTLTVKDTTETAGGVAMEGLVLIAGDAEFAPLHARASSLPYAAPGRRRASLSPLPRAMRSWSWCLRCKGARPRCR
jgi:hypothetical protein